MLGRYQLENSVLLDDFASASDDAVSFGGPPSMLPSTNRMGTFSCLTDAAMDLIVEGATALRSTR